MIGLSKVLSSIRRRTRCPFFGALIIGILGEILDTQPSPRPGDGVVCDRRDLALGNLVLLHELVSMECRGGGPWAAPLRESRCAFCRADRHLRCSKGEVCGPWPENLTRSSATVQSPDRHFSRSGGIEKFVQHERSNNRREPMVLAGPIWPSRRNSSNLLGEMSKDLCCLDTRQATAGSLSLAQHQIIPTGVMDAALVRANLWARSEDELALRILTRRVLVRQSPALSRAHVTYACPAAWSARPLSLYRPRYRMMVYSKK